MRSHTLWSGAKHSHLNAVSVTRHSFLTANTFKLKTTHAQKLQENESKG